MRAALLALALAACATPGQPLQASGESLLAAGRTFESVGGAMYALCSSRQIDARTCADWTVFGTEFKAAYTLAAAGWQVASVGLDGGSYDVTALLGQLQGFASLVADTIAEGNP